ncbi:MAG: fluoride efflux transporter CrcB [Caulobacter sp.]|nr:fluoride efflux transporter CrcB [Caulobacter sp.]
MEKLLMVAAGGAAGSTLRYLTGVAAGRWTGLAWPWGTLSVNILGGLLMGLLVGVLAHRGGADQERWRLLLGVGFLGGFTTFSAFTLETALMIERKALGQAFSYALVSVAFSLAALFAGMMLARRLAA